MKDILIMFVYLLFSFLRKIPAIIGLVCVILFIKNTVFSDNYAIGIAQFMAGWVFLFVWGLFNVKRRK